MSLSRKNGLMVRQQQQQQQQQQQRQQRQKQQRHMQCYVRVIASNLQVLTR